jgi:hypothetical protein
MKTIDLGKTMALVANIGVIGGILLLAYELRQNNELMAAEARQVRTGMVIDAWRFNAENGDIAEIRVRERNGEEISEAGRLRVDAYVMSVYVLLDWTFQELSASSPEMNQVRKVQSYNFANYSEYRRVWEARKNSFRPEFIQWMDENVANR